MLLNHGTIPGTPNTHKIYTHIYIYNIYTHVYVRKCCQIFDIVLVTNPVYMRVQNEIRPNAVMVSRSTSIECFHK